MLTLKEKIMKNVFYSVVVVLFCSTVFAGDCGSGLCRQPVRGAVAATVNLGGSVVGAAGNVARSAVAVATAPVRVTRNVLANSRARRCCRRSCR